MNALTKLIAAILIVMAFGFGFYGTMTYVLPMGKGDVGMAKKSMVADDVEVLLNGAAISFEKERYQETVKVLELALEELISPSGEYKLVNEWKIVRIQFLIGKSYHLLEKYDKAVEAYKATLQLDPDHLPAKYNLEMIVSQPQGGSDGNQANDQQPKI